MRIRLLGQLVLASAVVLMALAGSRMGIAQADAKRYVSYGGVSFTYDGSLATNVVGQTVAEGKVGPEGFWWEAMPRLTMFEFRGFAGVSVLKPAIYVIPVRSSYKSLYPGQNIDPWASGISDMRTLLTQKPDLHSFPVGKLPYLPPINAAAIPVGKQQYINFANGPAARYLVQITQDASPASRDDTFYTFQGLTNDGKYYIAAVFPAFPITPSAIPGYGKDITTIDEYSRRVSEVLGRVDNSAYRPDLNKLDDMMRSLSVQPTGVIQTPGMPHTGGRADTDGIFEMALLGVAVVMLAVGVIIKRVGYE